MMLFMSGAFMMACAACGFFFLKSWRATHARLFLLFAMAFWAMAVERVMLVTLDPTNEVRYYVYGFRLVAFVLIATAIAGKNSRSGR